MILAEQRRAERYDEIVVSPHLDDAVYSCAGRIAQRRREGKRVLVITLFQDGCDGAQKPGNPFGNFEERRNEDRAAMALLDADYVWLNLPDLIFRKHGLMDIVRVAFPFLPMPATELHAQVAQALVPLVEQLLTPDGVVLFPLSIGFHPDHRITFDVGRALHAEGRFAIEFYEDIAYAFFTTFVALRLRYLGAAASTPLLKAARDVDRGLFRFFRVSWLTFLPSLLYAMVLLSSQRLLGIQDRLPGEDPPQRRTRAIDDVIHDKVAAIRLYPSQTRLFLTMDDRVYEMLRGAGGYVEHTWVFPPFPPGSPRRGLLPSRPGTAASVTTHSAA